MRKLYSGLFIAAILAAGGGKLQASVIINPSGASDSGHYSGGGSADATKTTDGSGISNPALISDGAPVPSSYPTNDVEGGSTFFNNFVAFLSQASTVTYTFSAPSSISDIHFWQYSGDEPGRALATAEIWVTTNGTLYTDAGLLDTSAYAQPAVGTQDPGRDYAFSATNIVGLQLRTLVPMANPQADGFGPFVGFSEIRFVGTPEPASAGLLVCAGLGLLARRRRV